jgi:hypothetical protein
MPSVRSLALFCLTASACGTPIGGGLAGGPVTSYSGGAAGQSCDAKLASEGCVNVAGGTDRMVCRTARGSNSRRAQRGRCAPRT